MMFVDVILLIIFLIILFVLFVKQKYSFWAKNDVPFVAPEFPFGNFKEMGKTVHPSKLTQMFYCAMKGKCPFVGLYFFLNPVLLAIDVDFVKRILIKDFQYFPDRGVYFNEKDDPLSAHLFSIEGDKWRSLRAKIAPTFTSGKMKMTFPMVVEVAEKFCEFLEDHIKKDPDLEIKDLLSRFTIDIIGTCAFGIECNSFKEPENEFRKMGTKHFDNPTNHFLKVFLMKTFIKTSNYFGFKQIHDDVSEFFIGVVEKTIKYREENNVIRNDFLDLLIRLKKTGKLDDSGDEIGQLTFKEVAAQAFIFFTAGFETSSTTMMFCLYELALNQELQKKARHHVFNVLKEHNGKMTYEAASEMTFLDQCINESLRKYPPVTVLERKVDKDYVIPEKKIILPKGMKIMIPAYAIQHDPEIYPNPEVYDPERFTVSETSKRDPCAFLPFGEGPRICVGLRFGMIQTRVGLAMLLKNFKFTTCLKTPIPIIFSTRAFVLSPVNGLWLNIEKI